MKKIAIIAIGLSMVSSLALAQVSTEQVAEQKTTQSVFENVGATVKVGSTGMGIDVIKGINDNFKVRAGLSSFNLSKDYSQSNVNYQGSFKIDDWNILGDYHPFASGFRLTGGVYGPKHVLAGSATTSAAGSYTFNGNTYTTADANGVNLSVKWNDVSPYLGFGYDGFNKVKGGGGFFFTYDAGVIFTNSPSVSITANCTNAGLCNQLNADLAAERAKVSKDLNDLKYIPVLQIGVGYKF